MKAKVEETIAVSKTLKERSMGIDQFRLAAAVMVVAIHTFPFSSLNEQLDQVITLTIFRVAVPFFFLVTGYYILGPYAERSTYPKGWKIKQSLVEIGNLYLISCVIYLPLAFYTGVVSFSMSVSELLRVLVFEGPLYHLWYFPAVILGLLIGKWLIQRLSFSNAFLVTLMLYLIGLGGDSYYFFLDQLPVAKQIYTVLFQLFGLTRNGLFFSPFFLLIGAQLYLKRQRLVQMAGLKCLISLFVLGIEGFILHRQTNLRHDSMYLMLPLTCFYLFAFLLSWQPKFVFPRVKMYSLWLYILHPLSIVALYYGSKVLPVLQNSFLQFVLILFLTVLLIFVVSCLISKRGRPKKNRLYRAGKLLDMDALRSNYKTLQGMLPSKTKLMAVVKADAYGHGGVRVSHCLEQAGVDFFAVAVLEEAIQLRKSGIQGDILILGYTSPEESGRLRDFDLIQSIFSFDYAAALNRKKVNIRCHVKIDTGMNRLGIVGNVQELLSIYSMNYLSCEGIYSHLGSSDDLSAEARQRTRTQIDRFDQVLLELRGQGIDPGFTHLQSSYGIVNYPELTYDYARVGIFLYGVLSQRDLCLKQRIQIKPVLSIKAVLVSVKTVVPGEYIGYGTSIKVTKEMRIGTVAIGYADGIPRALSNTGYSLRYKDYELPQIGTICMDMLLIDVTEVGELEQGEELFVLESSEEIAEKDKTITNELLSRLGTRLESY